jgi:hypothetical protein
MDIKAILKARGLSDEQADKMIAEPAYASIVESFAKEAEDGKTALMKAQEIEQNLKTWNETQVVPYVRGADERVAKTEAKLAQATAHMKTLKDLGYDIPDGYLEAAPTTVTPPAKNDLGIDSKQLDERAMDIAKTNMALVSLSNRHRKLTGDELDLEQEYSDFEANKRPSENLRSYIARKYDHEGLQSKRAQEAEQKRLDEYAATKVQEEKAKWAQNNGVNPETRNPRASRFDQIKQDEGRAKLWQTAQGREKATQDRLAKYQNLVQ